MSKRSEEKRVYWRGVLERQGASGLSVRKFCRDEKIAEASFHGWKRKLLHGDRPAGDSSEKGGRKRPEAKPVTKQTDNAAVFIPVRVSPAANDRVEIVHPRGHVVRLPATVDANSLRQILDVLDRRADA